MRSYEKKKKYRRFILDRLTDGFVNDALGQWKRGNPEAKDATGMNLAGARLHRYQKSKDWNGKHGCVHPHQIGRR